MFFVLQAPNMPWGVAGWVLVLIVAIVLLIVVGLWARRMLDDKKENETPLWGLVDLRRLHADGQLDDDEYERLKKRMLAEMTEQSRRESAR